MQTAEVCPYIFISYRRTDGAYVLPIIAEMERLGYCVWYDVSDSGISGGGMIAAEIQQHIEQCAVFLAFLSEGYYHSDWCLDEIALALKCKKRVVPVNLDNSELQQGLNLRLARRNVISYRNTDMFLNELRKISEIELCQIKPNPDNSDGESKNRKLRRAIFRICSVSWILFFLFVFGYSIFLTLTTPHWTIKNSVLTVSKGILSDRMPNYTRRFSPPWAKYRNDITQVNIEAGVFNIGDYAFYKCQQLREVNIPNSITSIGVYAFYDCSNLTNVSIPDGVAYLGGAAFAHCAGLTNITIPESIYAIGSYAFSECSGLIDIVLPNGLTDIGAAAFSQCGNLISVRMPKALLVMGDGVFYGCTSLTSITIPKTLSTISKNAFQGCISLESVTIPDGVTGIAMNAFTGCTALTSVTIPGSVEKIGTYAFVGCDNLSFAYILRSTDSVTLFDYAFDAHTQIIYGSQ